MPTTGAVQKQHKKFTMSFYKINYEQLRQQPEITEMLSALERAFEKFGIDFYLVGDKRCMDKRNK